MSFPPHFMVGFNRCLQLSLTFTNTGPTLAARNAFSRPLVERSLAGTHCSFSQCEPAEAWEVDMCASKHPVAVRRLAHSCHASPSKPMRRAAHARERAS